MNDRDRVLAVLQAGHQITRVDFQPPVIDGGKPILNLTQRVSELRLSGHPIEDVGTRNRCKIYGYAFSGDPSRLFDAPEEGSARGMGPYDDAA